MFTCSYLLSVLKGTLVLQGHRRQGSGEEGKSSKWLSSGSSWFQQAKRRVAQAAKETSTALKAGLEDIDARLTKGALSSAHRPHAASMGCLLVPHLHLTPELWAVSHEGAKCRPTFSSGPST